MAYSKKLIGANSTNKSALLLHDYMLLKNTRDLQVLINIDGYTELEWPGYFQAMPKQTLEHLGAKEDYLSGVLSHPNPFYAEGLRILSWEFTFYSCGLRATLNGHYDPEWTEDYPQRKAILASETEGNYKIPGIEGFVRGPTSGSLLKEKQRIQQNPDLRLLTSRELNCLAQYLQAQEPSKEWTRSEIERHEQNGNKINEAHIIDIYSLLRSTVQRNLLVSGELLALPINIK